MPWAVAQAFFVFASRKCLFEEIRAQPPSEDVRFLRQLFFGRVHDAQGTLICVMVSGFSKVEIVGLGNDVLTRSSGELLDII